MNFMDIVYFYRRMYQIRKIEETFLELFSQGLLYGTVHTGIGQEAIAVGVLSNININKDKVFSNHRCHGHFLSLFDDNKGILSELMGKEGGICKGIGGSQHIHRGNFFANGIQGGLLPIAAGASFVEKNKNSDSVVVSFIG